MAPSKTSERSKVALKHDDPAPTATNVVATLTPIVEISPNVTLEDAASRSQLYFYRNKARLLEQDLAAAEARAKQDMAALLERANQAVAAATIGSAPVVLVEEPVSMAIHGEHLSAHKESHSEIAGLTARLAERDTLIGVLNAELARRDEMMRFMSFRIAWKYQRLPSSARLVVRSLILPFVAPYLAYRAMKLRRRGGPAQD